MSSAMSSSEPPRDQTQDEDYTLEDEYSALFDLSPQRFPWHEPVPQRVRQQRDIYDGTLFLDTMLEAAQVENARALYPPWDPESFGDLYNAVRKAKWDRMRKDCIVYYLLKWWEDGREVKFRRQRSIPPQFSTLADAYYFFDMGEATKAANLVIDARIPPNHSSKILRILSNSQDGGPTILRYVRSAHPVLTEQSSLDIYALALAESSLQDAWLFQRTFPQETPSRKQLIEKIVLSCLARTSDSYSTTFL
ncbi:hypothetical protein SISSUDRAFT_247398 [Sistotremastrum suecicum HHB10207 ss-3]|uniref:ELYS-like domain-containing protein n=1 Tax=Sistotremastrum suecicum HHB10207 ss-3 TaxID=1314776 RepID=A0A165ZYX4_9AGAM|nr:hypothetical protein SISSUDRAFT_247398 [Sistotremastrum suecicum HHB10207 ss-3]